AHAREWATSADDREPNLASCSQHRRGPIIMGRWSQVRERNPIIDVYSGFHSDNLTHQPVDVVNGTWRRPRGNGGPRGFVVLGFPCRVARTAVHPTKALGAPGT